MWVGVLNSGSASDGKHPLVEARPSEWIAVRRVQKNPILRLGVTAIALGFEGEEQFLRYRKQHALAPLEC
jgi:hypothetical protein